MCCFVDSRSGVSGTRARPVHLSVRRSVPVGAGAGLPRLHPILHLLVLRVALRAHPHDHQERHRRTVRNPWPDRRHLDLTRSHYPQVHCWASPHRRQRYGHSATPERHLNTLRSEAHRCAYAMTVPFGTVFMCPRQSS